MNEGLAEYEGMFNANEYDKTAVVDSLVRYVRDHSTVLRTFSGTSVYWEQVSHLWLNLHEPSTCLVGSSSIPSGR